MPCARCIREFSTSLAEMKKMWSGARSRSTTFSSSTRKFTQRSVCCFLTLSDTIQAFKFISQNILVVFQVFKRYLSAEVVSILFVAKMIQNNRICEVSLTSSMYSGSLAEASQRLLRMKMLGFERRSFTL